MQNHIRSTNGTASFEFEFKLTSGVYVYNAEYNTMPNTIRMQYNAEYNVEYDAIQCSIDQWPSLFRIRIQNLRQVSMSTMPNTT